MPKNITLSIPDDIAMEMESMPEINWSAVAKKSIRQYIEIRKHPNISEGLLEELSIQKNEEYSRGVQRADDIVHKYGYPKLNVIMRRYRAKLEEIAEMEEIGPSTSWETIPEPEEEMQKILLDTKSIETEASIEFLKGIRDRLVEIDKVIK